MRENEVKLELLDVDPYQADGTVHVYYPDGDVAAIVYGNVALDVDARELADKITKITLLVLVDSTPRTAPCETTKSNE